MSADDRAVGVGKWLDGADRVVKSRMGGADRVVKSRMGS